MTRFVYRPALRWSDMDVFGHINNVRFLTLLEEARVALFFKAARDSGVSSFAEGILIARHEIDYLRQVSYDDDVRIDLWVEELRAARFTVVYELKLDEAVACRARSVCVPFSLAGQHPRRLSEAERAFLTDWT